MSDDAGARKFGVLLDELQYSSNSLLSEGLSCWQGPSLLVYNDSVFSDNDFSNITQLGKSEKFEDTSRIGT